MRQPAAGPPGPARRGGCLAVRRRGSGKPAPAMEGMDVDLDPELMQKFSCLGTTDKDVLISEFQRLLGFQLNPAGCAFFPGHDQLVSRLRRRASLAAASGPRGKGRDTRSSAAGRASGPLEGHPSLGAGRAWGALGAWEELGPQAGLEGDIGGELWGHGGQERRKGGRGLVLRFGGVLLAARGTWEEEEKGLSIEERGPPGKKGAVVLAKSKAENPNLRSGKKLGVWS